MSTSTDQFPNVMIFLLAQSLALGGTETELYASTIKTLDGQTVETSDFSFLTEGVISVDVQSASAIEFISFTGVDAVNIGFTPITRGLSFKSKTVIPANVKFHPVGTPCIIAFGTHNLIDLETIIINNQAAIEAQIAALTGIYLELNGGNSPTADINWGAHKITNLENGTNPQDAVTEAQLAAAVIAGGVPATTTQGGYVKVATSTEFNNGTNTTVVGPFTFYNMATLSQLNSLGAATQIFTSSGTWTKPANIRYAVVEVIGGGGNGSGGGTPASGAGGGAGGYSRKIILASSLLSTETVTIASTTSFGSHNSATSGSNASNTIAGTGGVGTGGDINILGSDGFNGTSVSGNASPGGNGGASFYGASVKGGIVNGNGNSGKNNGDGGSGGGAINSGSTSGGSGTNGQVIITIY